MGKIVANYVEFDLPYCSLDFGQSPCTATGVECFNTRNLSHDCGDPANYTESTITVRFAQSNGYEFWPDDGVPTWPILKSVASRSAKVMPAEDMGTRASCTIMLSNCLSAMQGLDKNIIARDDPYNKGTFLGKFKSRFPYIFGSNVRVYRGTIGGEYRVEHYIIDNFSGPNNSGGMEFNCVDFLKLTNGKSSQFPKPTEGILVADMDETQTTFTVEPAGIGDIQYPASGKIAIGKEGLTFTRSGDVFTVTRGLYNVVEPHSAGDNVQVIGEYSGLSSAAIIRDLIVNYTPIDNGLIDFNEWESEINSYQSALYSAEIAKPEPVSKLINEIIEQAGLIFYADVVERKIKLRVLRPVSSNNILTTDKLISFSQKENQSKRVSQVWTYYNQKDPLKQLDDQFNYYSALISPTQENLYPTEVIKKIFSRWIPSFSKSVALDLNSRLIQRYVNPPREFNFNLFIEDNTGIGEGVIVEHRALENAFGDADPRGAYTTSLNCTDIYKEVTAQEYIFTEYTGIGGGGNILIDIPKDSLSVNLRQLYDSLYQTLSGVTSIQFVVKRGIFVGATNNQLPAITIGDFGGIVPNLTIENGAYVLGAGGTGSEAPETSAGGIAIDAESAVNIENFGTIAGGGGAGGRGMVTQTATASGSTLIATSPCGGTAGAGYTEGFGVFTPLFGLSLSGLRLSSQTVQDAIDYYASLGLGFPISNTTFGVGGGLGQSGSAGADGAGGEAGKAVINNSNINWVQQGTIIGAVE